MSELDRQEPAATAADAPPLEVTVIIPARNEEASLGECLRSLVDQSEDGFALGGEWELIVVDDDSTDQTRMVADGFPGVTVMQAPALEPGDRSGLTGKTNACWAAAQQARGKLLLFTDADTVHEPGSLSRARRELEKYDVALLSYSPRQIVSGVAQRLLMPLVFAELAKAYPMAKVNDPANRMAAANGQFLMVREDAYFAVGGHRGVGPYVLEDVALARNIKRGKRSIRFRYAPDAVAARMYRSTAAMLEGWTKNLALLFGNTPVMAAIATLVFLLFISLPALAVFFPFVYTYQRTLVWLVWARGVYGFYTRTRRSNFSVGDCLLAVFGLPLFVFLLLRSYVNVKIRGAVDWKGRSYSTKV